MPVKVINKDSSYYNNVGEVIGYVNNKSIVSFEIGEKSIIEAFDKKDLKNIIVKHK